MNYFILIIQHFVKSWLNLGKDCEANYTYTVTKNFILVFVKELETSKCHRNSSKFIGLKSFNNKIFSHLQKKFKLKLINVKNTSVIEKNRI